MIVLIVEDNIDSTIKIKNMIHKFTLEENIFIKSASKSNKALEIANQLPVDIFIIDIDLPDCSGLHLSKALRRIKRYRYTPIIIESNNKNNDFKSNVHESIDNLAYITKPFQENIFDEKFSRSM